MKDVLISLDEGLWGRMKARAALEGRVVKDVVANAFRVYLAEAVNGEDRKSDPDPMLTARCADAARDPKQAALEALRAGGLLTTGTGLLREQEAARARARKVQAYQDHGRSHPEDVSQDPADVPPGFEEE